MYQIYRYMCSVNGRYYTGCKSGNVSDSGYLGSSCNPEYWEDRGKYPNNWILEILDERSNVEEASLSEVSNIVTVYEDPLSYNLVKFIPLSDGVNNAFYGKQHTAESRELISRALAGHHNIDKEKNPMWKSLPWLHSRATSDSIFTWSQMPLLFEIWSMDKTPKWSRIVKSANTNHGVVIKSQLGHMMRYFYEGGDNLSRLFYQPSKTDFGRLISDRKPT